MDNGDWGYMNSDHEKGAVGNGTEQRLPTFWTSRTTMVRGPPVADRWCRAHFLVVREVNHGEVPLFPLVLSLCVHILLFAFHFGGHLYTTSLTTLTRYPDSMLGAMFGGDFPTARDPQGNYFIDRDGPLFRYVLNFLRTSELTLPLDFKEFDLLRKEADFYQIEPLIQCLNDPKPLYPMDTFEEVVELSSTRKLSKYSNPVAVIITQLTITTKVHSLLEGISNYFTKWNKHMMDTRDCQVSFTFGPCDYHQEVSLRVHLMEYITKQGFTIRNTRVHHMSERANENTVEHNWTFCRLARKTDD